jgi:hypothetical protein
MLIYACNVCGALCRETQTTAPGVCDCGGATHLARTWGDGDETPTCSECVADARTMVDPYGHRNACDGKVGG